ncbi:eORF10 [Murid betaherpesvirus 8]|uniref:EORF10 n=1 Tax=Rat cytomegalovirus (isolate England) TaxID=1261657 RepID=K7YNT7_RCMVE|nr:eORF10 [Murid betaherpesvirus 8]AFX83467.1 eORF10 [Murid betaherpesvirus 8]WEG71939.1 protein e169 [Murid betaherpesvirus 8]WPH25329.1 protein e169 [Murid betaherpesvirus 8]WPH25462.1 protein e169 [Murid betaherpesvirus 8]
MSSMMLVALLLACMLSGTGAMIRARSKNCVNGTVGICTMEVYIFDSTVKHVTCNKIGKDYTRIAVLAHIAIPDYGERVIKVNKKSRHAGLIKVKTLKGNIVRITFLVALSRSSVGRFMFNVGGWSVSTYHAIVIPVSIGEKFTSVGTEGTWVSHGLGNGNIDLDQRDMVEEKNVKRSQCRKVGQRVICDRCEDVDELDSKVDWSREGRIVYGKYAWSTTGYIDRQMWRQITTLRSCAEMYINDPDSV